MLRVVLLNFFIFFISLLSSGQVLKPYLGPMPTPPVYAGTLFYLQRTIDVNTVMYEVNYTPKGQINKTKPVKVYWIDFADGGKIKPLTFVQSKLAYGIESKELAGPEIRFEINLVSYKNIKMYLKPSGKHHNYRVHVTIKGKECILTNILVSITGGTYLKPTVSHIELVGMDLQTEERMAEKIKP